MNKNKRFSHSFLFFFVVPYLFFLIASPSAQAQERGYAVSGVVTDAANGEIIQGATVYVKERPTTGTTSNQYGFYSVNIPAGKWTLCCTFLGYETVEAAVEVTGNMNRSFAIGEGASEIKEVVVSTIRRDENLTSPQAGVARIDVAQMNRVPVMFGERDIMKSIQFLPGVKSEGDGTSGFIVRGGTTSQNLVLLDGAPINNAGHLMGFFSAFNSDALRSAVLYKGLMPAQYGGRTSSVFDVRMKEGNNQHYDVNGSVGLISAKLNIEGPIKKDKSSFFVAARRTYADAFLALSNDYKGTVMYFYDVNAKVNYIFSERDRIFASAYFGQDNFGMKDLEKLKWSNRTLSLRWYHQMGNRLVSNVSLLNSQYNSNTGVYFLDTSLDFLVKVGQTDLVWDIDWHPSQAHNVKIGAKSTLHSVTSGDLEINGTRTRERRAGWENAAWINEEWKISDAFTVTGGLRFAGFSVLGGDSPFYTVDDEGDILSVTDKGDGIYKTYWSVEPRFSASWRITPSATLKAAYSRTTQNIHTVSSGPMSTSLDRYFVSSNLIKPETADQYSLGFFKNLKNDEYELSAEVYYKDMGEVVNYRDGVSFDTHMEIERSLKAGKGRSYGLELFARKNTGRFTGWISYTLSRTETRIAGINNGKWYNADSDRTHDVSIVGMYNISDRWEISASWIYSSGQAMTLPVAKYGMDGETNLYYAGRNDSRAPASHRLDISATYQLKSRSKRYEHELTFGVFNAYCRYNPFMIVIDNEGNATQLSMFGIVPSVAYNFRF